MAVLTKTQSISVLTHQAITHPGSAVGASQDVSTHFSATIVMFHALVEATINTNPGSFHVQISPEGSGNESWATIAQYTANNTTADTEAMTASEPAGETVLAVASTTGFLATDLLYIQDTGALTNSEWNRCREIVSNVSIDLIDGLTNAKDASDIIWNDANVFVAQVDLTSVARLRVIFMHEGGTGANVHVKAIMITGDSVG